MGFFEAQKWRAMQASPQFSLACAPRIAALVSLGRNEGAGARAEQLNPGFRISRGIWNNFTSTAPWSPRRCVGPNWRNEPASPRSGEPLITMQRPDERCPKIAQHAAARRENLFQVSRSQSVSGSSTDRIESATRQDALAPGPRRPGAAGPLKAKRKTSAVSACPSGCQPSGAVLILRQGSSPHGRERPGSAR
jgi:hypothetical protein